MSLSKPVTPSVVAEHTMVIKKSCCYRARFQTGLDVHISPHGVVPHPGNRGGDPCKLLRCRSIVKDIIVNGCDVPEAEWNAVLIESPPADKFDQVRAAGFNPDYDAHFAENVIDPLGMCVRHGPRIKGGSVSHSHLNVTLRNVVAGMVGCECAREPAVAGM